MASAAPLRAGGPGKLLSALGRQLDAQALRELQTRISHAGLDGRSGTWIFAQAQKAPDTQRLRDFLRLVSHLPWLTPAGFELLARTRQGGMESTPIDLAKSVVDLAAIAHGRAIFAARFRYQAYPELIASSPRLRGTIAATQEFHVTIWCCGAPSLPLQSHPDITTWLYGITSHLPLQSDASLNPDAIPVHVARLHARRLHVILERFLENRHWIMQSQSARTCVAWTAPEVVEAPRPKHNESPTIHHLHYSLRGQVLRISYEELPFIGDFTRFIEAAVTDGNVSQEIMGATSMTQFELDQRLENFASVTLNDETVISPPAVPGDFREGVLLCDDPQFIRFAAATSKIRILCECWLPSSPDIEPELELIEASEDDFSDL